MRLRIVLKLDPAPAPSMWDKWGWQVEEFLPRADGDGGAWCKRVGGSAATEEGARDAAVYAAKALLTLPIIEELP